MEEAPMENSRWDRQAIRNGASVCVLIAVPFTLIARLALDEDAASGWALLLALGSFGGFVMGAGVAAWHQRRGTPVSHGIVTATGVFIVVQLLFSLLRVARGDSVNLARILVNLTLTLGAGVVGGFLGSALQRQGFAPRERGR